MSRYTTITVPCADGTAVATGELITIKIGGRRLRVMLQDDGHVSDARSGRLFPINREDVLDPYTQGWSLEKRVEWALGTKLGFEFGAGPRHRRVVRFWQVIDSAPEINPPEVWSIVPVRRKAVAA